MENSNQKKGNIEIKYLNNIQKNRFFKLRKKLLELQKSLIELKDREFHDKEVKLK